MVTNRIQTMMDKKTILAKYPDYDEFFSEISQALLSMDSRSEQDILNAYKYGHWLWLRWATRIHKGSWPSFLMRFKSRYASTFYEIRQKERIWNNIYKNLRLDVDKVMELKDIKYTKTTRDEEGDKKSYADESWRRERSENELFNESEKSGSRTTSKERPFETLDLLGQHYGHMLQQEYMGRADWLGGEDLTIGGYLEIERYPEGHEKYGEVILDKDGNPSKVLNPNWRKQFTQGKVYDDSNKSANDRSDHRRAFTDIIDQTHTRQEQPLINGQIARVIQNHKNFESYPTEQVESFVDLFSEFYVGGGKYVFNPSTWDYEYKTRIQVMREETKKPQDKEEDEEQKEVDIYRDLSLDEWKELWLEKTRPCMPDWYLEGVYRYKKRLERKFDKEDVDYARIEMCDTLLNSFYRPPYIPPISVYESVMGSPENFWLDENGKEGNEGDAGVKLCEPWTHYRVDADNIKEAKLYKKRDNIQIGEILECEIEGFAEFKNSLWEELRIAHRRRKNKVANFQTFPCMIGPPGTGKSEISRNLSIANKAPLAIINCAGIDDPGYFEGKRPTLQNASYGKVMSAFIDSSMIAEITIDDLKAEMEEIKTYFDSDAKRRKPRPLINITDWEQDKIKEIQAELSEWELENQERKNEGKSLRLTKKKAYRSRSPIIFLDEFEKIESQAALDVIGKLTDREMNFSFVDVFFGYRLDLSYAQFLLTANDPSRVAQFLKDRLSSVNIELLTWKQRMKIVRSRFTKEMRLYDLSQHSFRITDKFVEMCIPETWGVRVGITNVAAVIKFIEVLEVEKEDLDAKRKGVIYNPWNDITFLDKPDHIEETSQEDYLKREAGVIRLIWDNIGGKKRTLVLTKRLGVEVREIKEGDNIKRTKEIITGFDIDSGKVFVPDWGGENKKWIKEGNEVFEGTEGAEEKMWWYGYNGNKEIGYITRSLGKISKAEDKHEKVYPNKAVYDIRGKLELRREDDDNIYVMNNVNAMMTIGLQNLLVERIKLIAQLGVEERSVYEVFINDGVQRDYTLTVYNYNKTVWEPIDKHGQSKRQLTIYSKWNLTRT